MNSTFAVISTLVKSKTEEKCLISFLMNVSAKGLKHYLEFVAIYKGFYLKRKLILLK